MIKLNDSMIYISHHFGGWHHYFYTTGEKRLLIHQRLEVD